MTLRITNFGSDDVYVPLNSLASTTAGATGDNSTTGVNYYLYNGSAATSTAVSAAVTRVSGGSELTNSVRVSGGASVDIMLTVNFNPGLGNNTGLWRVQLGSVGTAATDSATATTLTATVPVEDFRTAYNTINN